MSAETVRNFYRKQGAEVERERFTNQITALIKTLYPQEMTPMAKRMFDQVLKGEVTEVIHQCPPDGSDIMPCCGRTPYEVPQTDRIALRRYQSLQQTPPNCQGEEQ